MPRSSDIKEMEEKLPWPALFLLYQFYVINLKDNALKRMDKFKSLIPDLAYAPMGPYGYDSFGDDINIENFVYGGNVGMFRIFYRMKFKHYMLDGHCGYYMVMVFDTVNNKKNKTVHMYISDFYQNDPEGYELGWKLMLSCVAVMLDKRYAHINPQEIKLAIHKCSSEWWHENKQVDRTVRLVDAVRHAAKGMKVF
jgi:hypothetical protein